MFGLSQKEKDFALQQALSYYSEEKLLKALRRGGDPNHTGYRFSGTLFAAASMYEEKNALRAVEILLEHKADVNKKADYGRNILHYMITHHRTNNEVFRKMIDAGADVHAVDDYGATPLIIAMAQKSWTAAQILLEKGGQKVTKPEHGYWLVANASKNAAPMDIYTQLFSAPVDVSFTPRGESPLLQLAVEGGGKGHLGHLLQQPGIPVDARDGEGATALLKAVKRSSPPMAELLLAAGAASDIADNEKTTPLIQAAKDSNQTLAEMLIKAGAKLGLGDDKGRTALTHAAERGNIRMVMTILAAAEERKEKLDLIPALDSAADKGHGRVVELLVGAGADVNATDKDGRTPLMRAALSDQVETLSILIKAGADPATADRHGMSAYDHAVSDSKAKAKEYLARYRNEKAAPAAQGAPQPVGAHDAVRLNDHSLEVREGDTLTMTFNFWTQQVIIRDTAQPAPPVVQNFADMQRQEAISEAFDKLKELGGNPPDPNIASALKKQIPGILRS